MTLNIPTLAMVDGHMVAGGIMIALAHDHVYCRDDTKIKIKLNEIELPGGVLIPEPMMDFIKAVTFNAARQLLLGQKFRPQTGLEAGFIHKLFKDDNKEKLIIDHAKAHAFKGSNR